MAEMPIDVDIVGLKGMGSFIYLLIYSFIHLFFLCPFKFIDKLKFKPGLSSPWLCLETTSAVSSMKLATLKCHLWNYCSSDIRCVLKCITKNRMKLFITGQLEPLWKL